MGKPTEFGRDVKGGDRFEGPWCGYMSNNQDCLSQGGEGGSLCLRARAHGRAAFVWLMIGQMEWCYDEDGNKPSWLVFTI
jgi:hypothetical protein